MSFSKAELVKPDRRDSKVGDTLEVTMTHYENKLRNMNKVDVEVTGFEERWPGLALGVQGRQARINKDPDPRRPAPFELSLVLKEMLPGPGGAGATADLDRQPRRREVVSIHIVQSADVLSRQIHEAVVDAVAGDLGLAAAELLDAGHRDFMLPELKYARALLAASRPPPVFAELNAEQRVCVEDIVRGRRITLTLGPPGTGKTRTIAAACVAMACDHTRAGSATGRGGDGRVIAAPPGADGVMVLVQSNVAGLNVLKARSASIFLMNYYITVATVSPASTFSRRALLRFL